MEKFNDLQYTISTPMSEASMKKNHGGGPSNNRLEAAVDTLSWIASKSLGYSQEATLKRKLSEIYPYIKVKMKSHTGVLVIAQYQKWKYADPANNPPQLLSVLVGPAASNRQSAYRKWLQMQKGHILKQGPKNGMVYGPRQLLWFTSISSKEESQKRPNVKQEKPHWKPAS